MSEMLINSQKIDAKQNVTYRRLPERVYYVKSPEDDTVLIGIDVVIKKNQDEKAIISWYDTSHERCMVATKMHINGERFIFKRADEEGGGTYIFEPMRLDLYEKCVKDRLANGKDFDNLDSLINAFLNTTTI